MRAGSARVLIAASMLLVASCTSPSETSGQPASTTLSTEQGPGSNGSGTVSTISKTFQPVALAFWNADHGLVTGLMTCRGCERRSVGMVLTTRDGGKTWRVVFRGGTSAGDVTTLGPGEALARVGRRLLRASAGGRVWHALGRSKIGDPSFVDPLRGWAVRPSSLSGRLVATTDGGRTWRIQHEPCGPLAHFWGPDGWERTSVDYVTDVWFVTPERGWVLCGGDGAAGSAPVAVFETTDGGRTWAKREAAWDAEPGGLQFLPDGRGWRWPFDFGYVARSPDGGATWHRGGTFANGGPENSIWFVNADTGFALGKGDLWRSEDGGRTWRIVGSVSPT
ncbi:MAG: hypothetical protein HY240_01945 [Actinobacteria bacterium]|nr:hypothetical protein [Actinomycetota bacterium]